MRLLGFAIFVLLVLPAAAEATFPGANGDMVYVAENTCDAGCSYALDMFDPADGRVVASFSSVGLGRPRFSPDGRFIAGNAGMIHSVDEPDASGPEVRVGDFPAWSPTGRQLVSEEEVGRGRRKATVLQVVTPSGRRVRRIPGPRNPPSASFLPDWSVRNEIVFQAIPARGERSPRGLYRVRPNGRGLRRITTGVRDRYPNWSPDGREIVFVRYGLGSGPYIYAVRRDGTGLRQITNGAGGFGVQPVWSPDGTRIAYNGRGGLRTVDARGRDARLLLAEGGGTGTFLWLDWAPRRPPQP